VIQALGWFAVLDTRIGAILELGCFAEGAEVAQVVEHLTENQGVGSSTLPLGTTDKK
jgi:hypothetical protein